MLMYTLLGRILYSQNVKKMFAFVEIKCMFFILFNLFMKVMKSYILNNQKMLTKRVYYSCFSCSFPVTI